MTNEQKNLQEAFEKIAVAITWLLKKTEEYNIMENGISRKAEEPFKRDGIKVFMYPEKRGKAHIHITNSSGESVSMSLEGDYLDGNCDLETLKEVKIFIALNKDLLTNMWNAKHNNEDIATLKAEDIKMKGY